MLIKKEQFIWDFYKNAHAKICSSLEYVSYNDLKFNNNVRLPINKLPKVIYVTLFPGYLSATSVASKNYKLKKFIHSGFSGAGIHIDGYESADSYLKELKKNELIKNLRRKNNRLEEDFSIDYEYNFGNISNEKCTYLLQTLKEMISERFESKIKQHSFMKTWDANIKDMAKSINSKKSSLFVIYANKKPISIQVNRHINNVLLFCETHSFDINYSKYGLGDLNYKINLDWSIQNDIAFIDFGNGVSYMKKKWCNTFYETYYLIFYKKKSLIANFIAHYEIFKIKFKNYIKEFKILKIKGIIKGK